MIDKLNIVEQRYNEVSDLIIQPDIIADQKRYIKLNKEYKDLSFFIEKIKVYKLLLSSIKEAESIINSDDDSEMVEMAKTELEDSKTKLSDLEEEIKLLLIPKDPEDSKNVVIEIRAGTGGDEASIFAGDLYRMYSKYCQSRGWTTSFVDSNEGIAGNSNK